MPSVLIVDDEAAVREVLERWLGTAGYETRAAADADAALAQMATDAADVVLCDVRMPGRDGLWLTEQLRTLYPSTAVILATGLDNVPGSTVLRDGVVGYVLKPFQRATMLQAVRDGVNYHMAVTG